GEIRIAGIDDLTLVAGDTRRHGDEGAVAEAASPAGRTNAPGRKRRIEGLGSDQVARGHGSRRVWLMVHAAIHGAHGRAAVRGRDEAVDARSTHNETDRTICMTVD